MQAIWDKAETAPSLFNNLCPQAHFIKNDLSSQVDIEVFKWDSQQMSLVQGPQCL